MSGAPGKIAWVRVVAGAVLAHLISIVLIAVAAWIYLKTMAHDDGTADFPSLARYAGLVLGPLLGSVLCLLFGRWAAIHSPGRERLAGFGVGVFAAMMVTPLLVNGAAEARPLYLLSMVLKIAAGLGGGFLAARRAAPPRATAVLAVVSCLLAWSPGWIQGAAETPDAAGVLAAEGAINAALLAASADALAPHLGDDLILSHAGIRQTGKEFLDAIRSGSMKYLSIENSGQHVNLYGQTAVVLGHRALRLRWNGQELERHLQYTTVFLYGAGTWRMVAYHSDEVRSAAPGAAR